MKAKCLIAILFLFTSLIGFSQIRTTKKIITKRVTNSKTAIYKKQIPVFKSIALRSSSLNTPVKGLKRKLEKLKNVKASNLVKFSTISVTSGGLNAILSPNKPIHSQASLSGGNVSWYPALDIISLWVKGNEVAGEYPHVEVHFNQKAGKRYLITIKLKVDNNLNVNIDHLNNGYINRYKFPFTSNRESDTIQSQYKTIEFIVNAANTGVAWFITTCSGEDYSRNATCGWDFKSCTIREVRI